MNNSRNFMKLLVFCDIKTKKRRHKKKSRDCKRSKIECYHDIKRLFIVFSVEHHRCNATMSLNFDNKLCQFFLSMKNSF